MMRLIRLRMILALMLSAGAVPLLALPQPAQASTCAAEGFVQSAAGAFASAARRGSAQGFASAASRYADLRGLAMFALGPYRQDMTPEQERKYIPLARSFMGQFMADNASGLSGGHVSILSCNGGGARTTVTAQVGSSTVIFRLAGAYRIEDVTVSGVSIASALRNKFTGVIRNNGGDIDALLTYLNH